MNSTTTTACPLCGQPAMYEIFRDPYTKHFECPRCVEFCIDGQSEKRLASMDEELRTRHSNHAKGSNPTRLWVIRAPNRAELAIDPNTTMRGEFIKRSGSGG